MIVAIVLVFPHRIYSNYLVGEPQGIIGTHNFVEADSSNTRDDLYMTGNNYALNMTKFEEWYSMSTDGTFNLNLMAELAKNRMEQTKQTNPNFYYGPVTGLLARNAGYIFPGRLLRNYSEEDPEGVLTMLDLDPSLSIQASLTKVEQPRRTSGLSTAYMVEKVTLPTEKDGSGFPRTGTRRPSTLDWCS